MKLPKGPGATVCVSVLIRVWQCVGNATGMLSGELVGNVEWTLLPNLSKKKKQQWQFMVQSTLQKLASLMSRAIHWILLAILLLYAFCL